MQNAVLISAQVGEVLDGPAFSLDELAHACGVRPDWVQARVEAGVLQVDLSTGAWRFDSLSVLRARRIVHLETAFDADPQLAALTADLIEEVTQLRRQLAARQR